jgi:aspartate/methionine/tyrosine aminotransferase
VPLHAIEEETLFDIEQLQRITTDALMIVCPNNPTGREPNQKQFSQIVEVCKSKGILLIIDFSFRFYSNLTTWDQYEVLYKSGIEFIAMEDTGKTFPLLDLKVSTIMANRSIHLQLQDISNDFLLNISPFILKLLTEFVKLEYKNALPSYQNTVNHNRKILSQYLKKSPVKIADVHSRLSVAWLVIPRKWNSMELAKWLKDKNIFVLPGTPFFWNDQRRGENYIRVALAKPVRYFTRVRSSILSPNVFLLDH